jgi:hypothetical protein
MFTLPTFWNLFHRILLKLVWISSSDTRLLILCRCEPLIVEHGSVMPDLPECDFAFESCVEREFRETGGVDDSGKALDVELRCIVEVQEMEQCRMDTRVLYGSQVRVTCEMGYTNGPDVWRPECLADGNFSDFAPCEPKSCGIFHASEHATSPVRYVSRLDL